MTAVSLFKVWYLLVYLQFSPIGAYDKYEIYQGKKQIATLEVTKDEIFNNSGKMLSFSFTENGVAQEYSVLVGFNSNVFLKSIKQGTNVILADNSKIQLNNFEYDTLHTDILIDIDSKELAKNNTGEQFASYNPQTMVFKLVEELNGQSEELTTELNQKYAEGI